MEFCLSLSFLLKCVSTKILLLLCMVAHAQHRLGTWGTWMNNARFTDKWGMNNDIQFRAGKDWSENSLVLIRPGVNYYVNESQTAAAGYAANVLTQRLQPGQPRVAEHRIWQQYILSDNLLNVPVQHRFRLEQRFLQRTDETAFAQRARYFIRGIIPVLASLSAPFESGLFVSLQNELFFNIQNKEALNGKLFDQNRAYVSVGHRFSPVYDIELGYMHQFLHGGESQANNVSHNIQLAIYTRF